MIRKWLAGKHWEADSVGVYPSHQFDRTRSSITEITEHALKMSSPSFLKIGEAGWRNQGI